MDPFYTVIIAMLVILAIISFTTDCYTSKDKMMGVITKKFNDYILKV